MKKSDLVKKIVADSDGKYSENTVYGILFLAEAYGMKPPTVRVKTPLGSQIFFDTNEWEEDINYDEEGYDKNDPDYKPHNPNLSDD